MMSDESTSDHLPHVSLRSLVLGGFLAMIGLLVIAGLQANSSLRAVPVLTSVGIAGAAGGAAFSMLWPGQTAEGRRRNVLIVASLLAYGAAVGAGFVAGRFGPF